MPIYVYFCPDCGEIEVEQKITDDTLTTCPSCGSPEVVKRPTAPGVVFKGSGFYQTDYKNKDVKNDNKNN